MAWVALGSLQLSINSLFIFPKEIGHSSLVLSHFKSPLYVSILNVNWLKYNDSYKLESVYLMFHNLVSPCLVRHTV